MPTISMGAIAFVFMVQCGSGPANTTADHHGEAGPSGVDASPDAATGGPADADDAGDTEDASDAPPTMTPNASSDGADVATTTPAPDSGDAGDGGPSGCDLNAPFGTPVFLAGMNLNTPQEEGGPRLSADERTLYFSARGRRDGSSVSDLFVAHRTTTAAPFDAPALLPTIASTWDEFDPSTATGFDLFFTSDRTNAFGNTTTDIWVASTASLASDFGTPVDLMAPINSAANEAQPFETADGKELWFSSDRSGTVGGYDIYEAPIGGGPAVQVVEVSSPVDDFCPILSANGLVVFFASARTDGASKGGRDIWSASRAQVTDPFSNVHDVTELNSSADDFPGWLSADGCRLYMSSTRAQNEDIYIATRRQ